MAKILVALTLASIGTLVTASSLKPQNVVTKKEFKKRPMLHNLNRKESPRGMEHLKPRNVVTEQEFMKLSSLNNLTGKKILQGLKLFLLTRHCEVSLPQKTSLTCQGKRFLERQTMKKMWKLTKSPFGFMLLDRTPIEHVFKTFLDPFTRFNMEDYLQTVLTSDLTHTVYSVLVKNASEIKKNYNYNILSKYFAVASKLGGEVALRPSQYESFVDEKDEWISDKFFTQQRLAGVNPMSLMRVSNNCTCK